MGLTTNEIIAIIAVILIIAFVVPGALGVFADVIWIVIDIIIVLVIIAIILWLAGVIKHDLS